MSRLLSILAFIVFAAPAAALAGELTLRSSLVSHGANVTLGDVFDGLEGPAATVILARAAPVGLDAVLDAGAVQLAARRAGLDWSNPSGFHRIAVTSVPGGEPTRGSSRQRTAGHGGRAPSVLIYARNLTAGELVAADDLIWSEEAVAPSDAIADPDAAIGKAARHALRAGAATASHDLTAPLVIHRDDVVAVVFETEGISLTLQGKSLGDATIGESVEVMNTQSKKIIDAVCEGPDRAIVGPNADALKAASYQPGGSNRLVTASLH